MSFNGDWNPSEPPFVAGIATLTHEEVIYVKGNCERIEAEYKPENSIGEVTPPDDYVISTYNNIDAWKKAINGDTYAVIKQYDPEINKLGINEFGIVQPEQPEETDEEELEMTVPEEAETEAPVE